MWHVEIKQEPIQNAVHDSKFADTSLHTNIKTEDKKYQESDLYCYTD